MNEINRDAFERAIEEMRNGDDHARQLIARLLARDSFEEAAKTACFYCQSKNLRLKSWQPPPMEAGPRTDLPDDGGGGWKRAEEPLHRLQAAGLSRYEPDPIAALERIERGQAA
jgi:hypothetical protein